MERVPCDSQYILLSFDWDRPSRLEPNYWPKSAEVKLPPSLLQGNFWNLPAITRKIWKCRSPAWSWFLHRPTTSQWLLSVWDYQVAPYDLYFDKLFLSFSISRSSSSRLWSPTLQTGVLDPNPQCKDLLLCPIPHSSLDPPVVDAFCSQSSNSPLSPWSAYQFHSLLLRLPVVMTCAHQVPSS